MRKHIAIVMAASAFLAMTAPLAAEELAAKVLIEYADAPNPQDGKVASVRNNNTKKVVATVRITKPDDKSEFTQEYTVPAGGKVFLGYTGFLKKTNFTITGVSEK